MRKKKVTEIIAMTDYPIVVSRDLLPTCAVVKGEPVIIAQDVIPAEVNSPLRNYANAISGSFSYSGKPCSILVAWGKTVCGTACHAHKGKPESVLYRLSDGAFGLRRCQYATELPAKTLWAIGGVGLLDNWYPSVEGFTGSYADVLRKTAHTFIGVKDGLCVLGYVHNMTGEEVNQHVKALGLTKAIMLDGGHVAAINCIPPDAPKINVNQKQFYIIQGV